MFLKICLNLLFYLNFWFIELVIENLINFFYNYKFYQLILLKKLGEKFFFVK
jgi:hypothetical protein